MGELFTVRPNYSMSTSDVPALGEIPSSSDVTVLEGKLSLSTEPGFKNIPSLWHDSQNFKVRPSAAIVIPNLVTGTFFSSSQRAKISI